VLFRFLHLVLQRQQSYLQHSQGLLLHPLEVMQPVLKVSHLQSHPIHLEQLKDQVYHPDRDHLAVQISHGSAVKLLNCRSGASLVLPLEDYLPPLQLPFLARLLPLFLLLLVHLQPHLQQLRLVHPIPPAQHLSLLVLILLPLFQ
jgi:hypothetical protein